MSSLYEHTKEYELLTPDEKAYVVNGCGPKFGNLVRLVPDFCDIYTDACNLHDWLYWSGGPAAIKRLADKKMKVDMEKINSSMSWRKRLLLFWVPTASYLLVKYFGRVSYYRAPYRRERDELRREMRDAII